MNKNVVIIGGAGFVGSILAYYLYNLNYNITVIDNLSYGYIDNLMINGELFCKFIKDDIRVLDFDKYINERDIVFNFAGIAPLPSNQIDPQLSYNINVAGNANVLEACRRKKASKVIFSSTSAVYENNNIFPVKESDDVSPYLTYSLGKKHCEDIIKSYIKLYDMDITILRFFNVYGPHHDFKRKSPPLISYIIKCMMLNEVPTLYNNNENTSRDYIYVDDICKMCEIIINNKLSKGEIFNICSNTSLTVNEIYNKIAKIFNSDIKPIFKDPKLLWDKYPELNFGYSFNEKYIEKEVNKYCIGSYDKAKNILKWEPKTDFDAGIKATIDYAIKTGL